jgi:hypothetical protein
MNRFFVASFFAFTAVVSADNAALAGKWQVHTNVSGHENNQACTFQQTGNDLTGTCSSDRGELKISGKIADKTVTWMYKSEYEGNPLTVTYKGTVDETGKISGTVNVEEYGAEGEFTATQSK